MRYKIMLLVMFIVLGMSRVVLAQGVDLETAMQQIASNYKVVLSADNQMKMEQGLKMMKQAALQAKEGTPNKLKDEASDSVSMQDYRQGLDQLIAGIDTSLKLAESGELSQAKAEALKLKLIRNTYHKKYR